MLAEPFSVSFLTPALKHALLRPASPSRTDLQPVSDG
jgi:hypothetical protein